MAGVVDQVVGCFGNPDFDFPSNIGSPTAEARPIGKRREGYGLRMAVGKPLAQFIHP